MTDPAPTQPEPPKPDDAQDQAPLHADDAMPNDAPRDAALRPKTDGPIDDPEDGYPIDAPEADAAVPEPLAEPGVSPAIEVTDAIPSPPMRTTLEPARWHESEMGWLRVVIIAWCLWLMGAWAMAWVTDTSVPRVRWMLFAGSFGLMLAWPAFRLSERTHKPGVGFGTLAILLEWFALVGVYQAVIWSLNFIALWPFTRGAWLDVAVVSWSLLTALIVAAARVWPGSAARLVGMLLCIALVFAEPLLMWASVVFAGGEGWPMRYSPIQAFWELTQPAARSPVSPWDERALSVALVAITGWIALGLWALGQALVTKRQAHGAAA